MRKAISLLLFFTLLANRNFAGVKETHSAAFQQPLSQAHFTDQALTTSIVNMIKPLAEHPRLQSHQWLLTTLTALGLKKQKTFIFQQYIQVFLPDPNEDRRLALIAQMGRFEGYEDRFISSLHNLNIFPSESALTLMTDIFNHMISNAIDATAQADRNFGIVRIAAYLEDQNIVLEIDDEGIGMAPGPPIFPTSTKHEQDNLMGFRGSALSHVQNVLHWLKCTKVEIDTHDKRSGISQKKIGPDTFKPSQRKEGTSWRFTIPAHRWIETNSPDLLMEPWLRSLRDDPWYFWTLVVLNVFAEEFVFRHAFLGMLGQVKSIPMILQHPSSFAFLGIGVGVLGFSVLHGVLLWHRFNESVNPNPSSSKTWWEGHRKMAEHSIRAILYTVAYLTTGLWGAFAVHFSFVLWTFSTAIRLKWHLRNNAHPGGPIEMLVDNFRRGIRLMVLGENHPLVFQFPSYSRFLKIMISELIRRGDLRKLYIEGPSKEVQTEVLPYVREWMTSNIPDFMLFKKQYPPSPYMKAILKLTNDSIMPMLRIALEHEIAVYGFDNRWNLLDPQSRTDPFIQLEHRSAEIESGFYEEILRTLRLEDPAERALILTGNNHAALAPRFQALGHRLALLQQPMKSIWMATGVIPIPYTHVLSSLKQTLNNSGGSVFALSNVSKSLLAGLAVGVFYKLLRKGVSHHVVGADFDQMIFLKSEEGIHSYLEPYLTAA